jgi:hypothetical protein
MSELGIKSVDESERNRMQQKAKRVIADGETGNVDDGGDVERESVDRSEIDGLKNVHKICSLFAVRFKSKGHSEGRTESRGGGKIRPVNLSRAS